MAWVEKVPEALWQAMGITAFAIWAFLGVGFVLGQWDRSYPSEVIEWSTNDPMPGGMLYVAMTVRQDPTRDCKRVSTLEITDSRGVRYGVQREVDFREEDHARPPVVQAMRRLPVPLDAAPGPAVLVFRTEFACTAAQLFVPIEKVLRIPFTIRKP